MIFREASASLQITIPCRHVALIIWILDAYLCNHIHDYFRKCPNQQDGLIDHGPHVHSYTFYYVAFSSCLISPLNIAVMII